MSDQIAIFAAQGVLAQEAVETLARLEVTIAAAVVTGEPEWNMAGLANIVDITGVSDSLAKLPIVVPVWSPRRRRDAVTEAREAGFETFATLIDPTAVVAASARIGRGACIHSGANVGAGVEIGEFSLVNRGALVSHHCKLDPYVTTGSGVTLSSRCHVGEAAILGAGCTLTPNRKVGADATVAAGAVVVRDVAAGTTVIGNPARPALGKRKG